MQFLSVGSNSTFNIWIERCEICVYKSVLSALLLEHVVFCLCKQTACPAWSAKLKWSGKIAQLAWTGSVPVWFWSQCQQKWRGPLRGICYLMLRHLRSINTIIISLIIKFLLRFQSKHFSIKLFWIKIPQVNFYTPGSHPLSKSTNTAL